MGTRIKDYESRANIRHTFTGAATIGPFKRRGESHYRVVVENAGATNSIQPQGRLFGQTDWQDIGLPIEDVSSGVTVDVKDYDEVQFVCGTYDALSAAGVQFIASGFFFENTGSGGGGGAVDSVNGQTGVVVLNKSSIGLGNVNNTSDANKPVSTAQALADTAVQNFAIDRANHTGTQAADTVLGSANLFSGFNGAGELSALAEWQVDTDTAGARFYRVEEPNNVAGNFNVHSNTIDVEPIQNSPNESWAVQFNQIRLDTGNTGFDIGTVGTAARAIINDFQHQGTSNVGLISFIENNFSLGNGTDPIDIRGINYIFGFGQVAANVNINGAVQGYGFQPNVNAAATIDSGQYVQAFYDAANIGCASPNYTSFNASPTIEEILNNSNYQGFAINPNINTFTGNANGTGVQIGGDWGAFGATGGWNGVNVNPTMTNVQYANGISVSMDSVAVYAGSVSSVVVQDLTIAFQQPADQNAYQIEYVDDVLAGAETAALAGQLITVHIESGVSTASQVKAAIEANFTLAGALTVTVSGVGTNTQVSVGPTNFTGGTNPGTKRAAYFDGNVEITGSLTFGGSLSIGALNAFVSQALVDTGGNPQSLHSLITQPTVAANATLTSADMLGVNTAALITIGDNATVGTSFIGMAALGLPAVLSMGTGSTLDRCYGALFALSLDASATGGTVDEVALCKSLAIPNGATTVNQLYGYLFDLPFGDPGTTTWGFYSRTTNHNYMGGDLLIGGTAGSDDVVSNSSVALEIKSTTKAMVLSRMTTAERNAMTAIAGMVIFNTTTAAMECYDGATWV